MTLTISTPTIPQIEVQDLTVVENGAPQTADVVVVLSAASSNPVTVNYTVNPGSAQFGTDYSVPYRAL